MYKYLKNQQQKYGLLLKRFAIYVFFREKKFCNYYHPHLIKPTTTTTTTTTIINLFQVIY
jgi:hypothetical protein